jgi:hypothetical protein
MTNRADDEMVEGYRDGRDANNPEPNANRSKAYRHGFQSGRDDLARKPSAPYQQRRDDAERIIADNE